VSLQFIERFDGLKCSISSPQGLKLIGWAIFSARLKSCPDTKAEAISTAGPKSCPDTKAKAISTAGLKSCLIQGNEQFLNELHPE
jgi:hypothetical protein